MRRAQKQLFVWLPIAWPVRDFTVLLNEKVLVDFSRYGKQTSFAFSRDFYISYHKQAHKQMLSLYCVLTTSFTFIMLCNREGILYVKIKKTKSMLSAD